MIEKILLPVDFSPRDRAAAHYVRELGKKLSFETILLHVVPPPDYEAAVLEAGGPALDELIENRKKLAAEKLDRDCLDELAGMKVTRKLLSGFPSEEIIEYATAEKVDLIVMPTHGYGPFRRFLLGSVVSKVLHDAQLPVMTGAHMQDPKLGELEFRTVAAAVDLGPDSPRVVAYAAGMAKALGAKLKVLHALAEVSSHMGFNFEAKDQIHFEKPAREMVEQLCTGIGVPYEVEMETGDPGETVCELVKRTNTDLLVIGRSSASGLGRLRAHAYSIIRESNVPVVSV
jgi:nucleotide-binding universal stress UspA family protein